MPYDVAVIVGLITLAFALFGVTLAWAEARTRNIHRS